MTYEIIFSSDFPYLGEHYDGCDEGHTRGHYEFLLELYDQSIEKEEDIKKRDSIEKEKKSFVQMVEETGEEFFSLVL